MILLKTVRLHVIIRLQGQIINGSLATYFKSVLVDSMKAGP